LPHSKCQTLPAGPNEFGQWAAAASNKEGITVLRAMATAMSSSV
jgi:hypothetical protein